MAPLQPEDGGRLARAPAAALTARHSGHRGLHNAAEIMHTAVSRDQPVPRKSKRESLHRTQGGPVDVVPGPFAPEIAARLLHLIVEELRTVGADIVAVNLEIRGDMASW